MFVILVNYKKPLEVVDQFLSAHDQFLDHAYKNNYFVVSGRRNPRVGGVIISNLKDRAEVEKVIQQDPYFTNGVADYEIIEFVARKFHPDFSKFLD